MLKSGKRVRVVSGIAVGLLMICLLLGMMLQGKAKPKIATEDRVLVRAQTIDLAETEQNYTYSGVVRGRYESNLAFQVNGKIISRNVDLGSVVKPGEVLLRIDPVDIRQGVNSADAQVDAAESQYQLAKVNLQRYERLLKKELISQLDYDRMKTTYDAAAAMLRQAKAQNANSQSMLSYCNLAAGNAGVVSGVYAEVGQVVAAGQPVVTVVRDSEREVEINVPENRLEEVRNSRQLSVKFWALPNLVITGKIREVAPMADPMSRTYTMRISLLVPPPELKLGMTAQVTATDAGKTGTVDLPLAAVYQTGKTPAVWVVKNRAVYLRPIKIGEFGDDQVQVLEGLEAGDIVVTAGVHRLRQGQKVRLEDDRNE
jgi:multidrug efflux system membrane fusion protein